MIPGPREPTNIGKKKEKSIYFVGFDCCNYWYDDGMIGKFPALQGRDSFEF